MLGWLLVSFQVKALFSFYDFTVCIWLLKQRSRCSTPGLVQCSLVPWPGSISCQAIVLKTGPVCLFLGLHAISQVLHYLLPTTVAFVEVWEVEQLCSWPFFYALYFAWSKQFWALAGVIFLGPNILKMEAWPCTFYFTPGQWQHLWHLLMVQVSRLVKARLCWWNCI